ncbi:MAG TPA: serine/threonine-protein kinase [Pyrinomonadaceae bacterium]|jgi:serine/threonine protein kinase|nr:serine/threonine-protein kinase [Pyrinomonadaceae bacterium]
MLNLIGQTLDGKYAIERELGRGGMGTVYFANHIGTERPVAVKVISPQFMAKNEFVERFRREARAAGRLRHPNVVDVTDFGIAETKDGSVAYLVMEYLDGCTLGEILEEEKKLPLSWSLDILEQVCSAVNEAHEQGIIHRDLKPDNIWLEPNQRGGYTVKVLDFGIAKLEEHMVDNARRGALPTSSTGTGAFRQQSTVVDQERPSGTMLMEQNSTTTINTAFNDESGTQMSEAGTLVKPPEADAEVDLESGTAIMPGAQNPQTQTFAGDSDKTQLMSAVPVETDKPEGRTSVRGAGAELTRVGAVLGTPLYMSPEQCRGEKLDQRSDIYSLGIITYQMLGGDTPFTGNYSEVMQAHKDDTVPPLQAGKVSRRVKKTVMSALAKDPEQRPQTAEAYASILRANSEGMGALLKKAISIYGEHLPKFFLFSFIIGSPFIFLTFLKVALQLLGLYDVIDSTFSDWAVATIAIVNFFVQIFFGAVVVGATTWIVAQILAMPLRPISVRAAAQEVRKKWKPLIIAVTLNTLMVSVGIVLCFIPGIWLTTRNMLVAPAIIMEGISWRESFRRSKALVSRSYWTVLGTVLVLHVIPIFFAMIISLSIMAMVRTGVDAYEKKAGVVKPAPQENKDIGIKIKPNGVSIAEAEIDPEIAEQMGKSYLQKTAGIVSQGIFEIIWAPIVIFITSFISVITALVYFKTRQAGGESMQDLLKQFEASDRPRRKWQERIRHRLVVSGRSASKSTSKP